MAIYKVSKKNLAAGVAMAALFIAYEENEDRDLGDKAYKDYQGALIGLPLEAWLDKGGKK